MPVHRFQSGPEDPNVDVLEAGVTKIESAGEEVVAVLPWQPAYPVGEWVVVTRKTRERAVTPRQRAETRRAA